MSAETVKQAVFKAEDKIAEALRELCLEVPVTNVQFVVQTGGPHGPEVKLRITLGVGGGFI